MDCFSCANPAINECKRCAKAYCEDHGNAQFCADCLRPASAVPSSNLYFGALLVMLVGTALAVYLIVRPPGDSSGAATVAVEGAGPTAHYVLTLVLRGAPRATANVAATIEWAVIERVVELHGGNAQSDAAGAERSVRLTLPIRY